MDALRGFALFGVYAANLSIFSGLVYMKDEERAALFPSPLDGVARMGELFFIENKFMGLFSILFGVSFWLFLERVRLRRDAPVRLFYRRIAWLFAIGAVHGWLFWCFDILRFYALWAVVLPLAMWMPPRRLLAVALCASVLIPAVVAGIRVYLPAGVPVPDPDAAALAAFSGGTLRDVLIANFRYDWFLTLSVGQIAYQVAVAGRLLLGLYVARVMDFRDLGRYRVILRRVVVAGTVIGTVGGLVFVRDWLAPRGDPLRAFTQRFLVESGYLAMSLAYASGLALMYLRASTRRVVTVLAPVGQMALSLYLLQTVLGIALFYGFAPGPGLMGHVGPAALVGLAIGGYVLQVAVAHAWMRVFRFGPAEWLWRSLTYWQWQPMKRP